MLHGAGSTGRTTHRAAWLVVAVLVAAVPFVGASAGGASGGNAQTVRVTVQDFKIRSKTATVRAGLITFQVANHGPSTHEFNVDRTDVPAGQLPLSADGLTVDELSPALARVGSIDALALGDTQDTTLRLKPGHYVLYCNFEGHYLSGMHFALDVQ
jgi:uncharacterized cupredoxin-like copper-binding protein